MSPESKKDTDGYQNELKEARSAAFFLDRIFNETTDSILIIDPQSYKVLSFNQSALNNLALKESQLLGKTCHQLFYNRINPCESPYKACQIRQILETSRPILTEYDYTDSKNKAKTFEISANPIRSQSGAIVQIAFFMRDITDRKREALQKKNILEIDEITGLYNQPTFYKKLKIELSRSKRHRRPVSLVLIGIDNKKGYESLSILNKHTLLAQLARFIKNNIRDIDVLFRYAEESFALILPETKGAQAMIFANRLKEGYYKSREDLIKSNVVKNSFTVTLFSRTTFSLGLIECQAADEFGVTVKKAEKALKQAQLKGNNIFFGDN